MSNSQKISKGVAADGIRDADLFSFRPTGRPLCVDGVVEEFCLMRDRLKKPLTVGVAIRICQKSGSHLLKLVSPRADGDHACLYFGEPGANRRPSILPSTNAPDIPYCKVIFRPLEIKGHLTRSVVDHIMNPDEISESVLSDFASVFGEDVLEALKKTLLEVPKRSEKLGAGEFPIIFVPRPGGGDLQITPVSPAAAFMGMKCVTEPYFQKVQPDAPKPRRGRWTRQAVSSKPQNISGAIGGPRVRLLATMPDGMNQTEAEHYRYIKGGRFPRWRNEDVAVWVLRYADMLERDASYNNRDTRAALDRTADRLIRDAETFIAETLDDAGHLAALRKISCENLPEPPEIARVLMDRRWPNQTERGRARQALTSPNFEHRLSMHLRRKGGA